MKNIQAILNLTMLGLLVLYMLVVNKLVKITNDANKELAKCVDTVAAYQK